MSRRVVITGMAGLTPIGTDWSAVRTALERGISGIQEMPDWRNVSGLTCHAGAPVDFDGTQHFKRRALRSMGRVAQLAVRATELAVADAQLQRDVIQGGRCGVAYGSATGSPDALLEFVSTLTREDANELKATSYLRSMAHTAAVNISVYLGTTGRTLTTTSACTAGSQAIGFAYENIAAGFQDVMLAGGADELTVAHSGVFDTLLACSKTAVVKPFAADRDGLVLGEGAATLVLEALEHAQARNAPIHGEVVGFATNADGQHITQPNAATQADCMQMALHAAGLTAADVDAVSAHGTATEAGDVSEVAATLQVLGSKPMSSLKGHLGHTLGACGAIEAWVSTQCLNEGWVPPTLHLTDATIDPTCAGPDFVVEAPRAMSLNTVMSNNFAFGGINTSLILKRFSG